jgi:hypothetical protein
VLCGGEMWSLTEKASGVKTHSIISEDWGGRRRRIKTRNERLRGRSGYFISDKKCRMESDEMVWAYWTDSGEKFTEECIELFTIVGEGLLWGEGGGSERKFITEGRRLRGGNGWTDYSENRRRLANEGIKRRKVTINRVISLIFGLGFAYVTDTCRVPADINHIVFSSNPSESVISLF